MVCMMTGFVYFLKTLNMLSDDTKSTLQQLPLCKSRGIFCNHNYTTHQPHFPFVFHMQTLTLTLIVILFLFFIKM